MARVILMTDFSEAYARRLLLGIAHYAHDVHEAWSLSRLATSTKEKVGMEAIVKYARTIHADAIIGQFEPDDNLDLFKKEGIIVIAQDYKSRFLDIPNITANHYEAGQRGAEYFLKKGFNSFAFFGPADVVFSDERYQGFSDTVKKERPDAKRSSLRVHGSGIWGYDLDEVSEWLKYLPKPVAIMASDDNWAYYITEAVEILRYSNPKGGFRIPEDISVLGVDNDEAICKLSNPNLSSIDQDVEKAGYRVAKLIQEMICNPGMQMENIYVAQTNIITRQSSDIFVNDNQYIATVLKYIHEHINHKLYVDDIVAQVPLSRRLLETKFRESMGTSIYNYIRNVRVEKMAELLRNGMTVSEAAFDLGFGDIKNMSRTFKSVKGVSPSEYHKNQ